MTGVSENGWGLLAAGSSHLRPYTIGGKTFTGRTGPGGFTIAHIAQNINDYVERIVGPDNPDDDHWHGIRDIGNTGIPSNHQSATAIDINALRHPQHQDPLLSFTSSQVGYIHRLLKEKYRGIVVWGGDWSPANVDCMHFELEDLKKAPKSVVRAVALDLVQTPVGKRLIAAQTRPVRWETW